MNKKEGKQRSLIVFWILSAFIPILLVHILYKIEAPSDWFISDLTAGDILGYIGSVYGAIATIISIMLTINFSIRNQKEERKVSIKPYLSTESDPIFEPETLSEIIRNKPIYIKRHGDQFGTQIEVPYSIEKIRGENKTIDLSKMLSFLRDNYLIHYRITNMGAGNAIGINYTINGLLLMPEFCISVNEKKEFVIFIEREMLKAGEMNTRFDFKFSDVSSLGKYRQSENFIFLIEGDNQIGMQRKIEDLLSRPEEL